MDLLFLTIGLPEMIILVVFVLFAVILYFHWLFHSATNKRIPSIHRLLAFFIILGLPFLRSSAYWFMGKEATTPKLV